MVRLTPEQAAEIAACHYYPGEPIEMETPNEEGEASAPETYVCADCGMPITTLIYRLRAADLCRACAVELAKSMGAWYPGREEND